MGQKQSKLYSLDGVLRQENAEPMGRAAAVRWREGNPTVSLMIDQGTYTEIGETEDVRCQKHDRVFL